MGRAHLELNFYREISKKIIDNNKSEKEGQLYLIESQ